MFLLSSVCVYMCVCWGQGVWQTEVVQEQVLKWSLTYPSLINSTLQREQELKETYSVLFNARAQLLLYWLSQVSSQNVCR